MSTVLSARPPCSRVPADTHCRWGFGSSVGGAGEEALEVTGFAQAMGFVGAEVRI